MGLFEFCLVFFDMKGRYFFSIFLVVTFLVGLVYAADETSEEEGFWDLIVDFFENIFSVFTGKSIVGISPIPSTGEWWNSSWHYRVGIEVDMDGFSRIDFPVEVLVDFRNELDAVGDSSALDVNSIRVVEYNSSGYILQEIKSDFELVSGESGNVVFILNGSNLGSEVRDFLIYFDSVDRVKGIAGYSSTIDYNFDGNEFDFDNGLIDVRVDTSRAEGTSGIYYAERVDYSKIIFDVPSNERTAEYLRFYNGSNYFGVDLDGNASLEFNGSVKKIVLQRGNEVNWGTSTSTGNEILKRYTVYDGSPWIFVEHVFRNLGGASISRRSDGVGVSTFDVDRVFGIDNLIGPGGAGADPFSWKSVTKNSGAFGVGVINYEEAGTSNYFVQGSVFSGVVGTQLSSTTINSGENISNKVAVYFNNDSTHTGVSDLKDRLETPASLTLGSGEEYIVDLNLSTEFDIYNLNESVLVLMDVLTDSHDLVRFVNATFDMGTGGTGDDVVLELKDDGLSADGAAGDGVYGGWYTLDIAADIGAWNISAEVYDKYSQDVGDIYFGFNVSNKLNVNLSLPVSAGLVGWNVIGYFVLENVRNDSYVSGVVNCSYNGTSVSNISEISTGNYSVNFNAPGVIGIYELVCSGINDGNSGNDSFTFYADPDTTTFDFDFDPASKVVSGITQVDSENFTVGVNITNTGLGRSFDVNISLIMPSGDFVANSSLGECSSVSVGENCSRSFLIDVASGTLGGNYNVGMNVSWINPDLSLDYLVKNLTVTVDGNAIFNLSGFVFETQVGEGEVESYANFSVDSIGNAEVLDTLFSCVSGEICDNFTVGFVPSNFSSVSAGSSSGVEVFVGVPEGYDPGNYSGVIGVGTLNAGIKSFNINVSVGSSGTWNISAISCSRLVLVEAAGDVCEIELNNSGNIELNFSILPSGGNYTYVSPQNFSIAKQSNNSFFIRYNTTGAPPQETFVLDYILSVNGGSPGFMIVNVSLEVVFGPEIWLTLPAEAEQGSGFIISVNVSDRSISGIDFVRANVTHPGGSVGVVNLTNTSVLGVGGYSLWEVNYIDNFERGDYEVVIYSEDVAGGTGGDNGTLMIFANLNVSLRSGWEDYLLGESGTIYYSVEDYAGVGLVSDVNISVRDSEGFVRYYGEMSTNALGGLDILPSFDIASDSVVGSYILETSTGYDDLISGNRILDVDNDTFDVYDNLFISLDTSVTWYPNSVMAFYLLVYSTSILNVLPSDVDLVVYDPAQAQYTNATLGDFTLVSSTSNSALYLYKYAMPVNSPTGDFLATVNAKEGTRSFQDVQSFRVSSGGPFDLILNLSVVDAVRGGSVPFEIIMKNMGEVPQDVYLDYWVADTSGNNYSKVTGEAIFVDAMDNTTISRTLPIFDWQSLGEHVLYVTMDYSTVIGPITTSKNFFVIEGNETEPEPEPGPTPAPGGSGGGGGAAVPTGDIIFVEKEKDIVILDIDPDELEIERGGVVYLMVEMKNNLDWDLVKVAAELAVNGEVIGESGVLDLLPMDEKVVLPVKVSVSEDYVSGFYSGEIRVYSGSVEAREAYQVNVFDSKDELLRYKKSRLEDRLENLRARTVVADNDGFDVGEIFDKIQGISLDFDLFGERLEARKYLESVEYLGKIEDDIESVEYELDGIISVVRLTWLIPVLVVGILILLLLIIWVLSIKVRRVLNRVRFEKLRNRYNKKVKKRRRVVSPNYKRRKTVAMRESDYLKTLKEQYKYGYISKAAYDEARGK